MKLEFVDVDSAGAIVVEAGTKKPLMGLGAGLIGALKEILPNLETKEADTKVTSKYSLGSYPDIAFMLGLASVEDEPIEFEGYVVELAGVKGHILVAKADGNYLVSSTNYIEGLEAGDSFVPTLPIPEGDLEEFLAELCKLELVD